MNGNLKKQITTIVAFAAVSAGVAAAWNPAGEILAAWARPAGSTNSMAVPPQQAGKPVYHCAMHPQVTSDKPGNCPICGMKLVKMEPARPAASTSHEGSPPSTSPGTVQISTARQQLLGVVSEPAQFRSLDKTLRAVGRVALDEELVANVHIKVSGWVKKVFVDYTFQHVRQGDPLFTLYSPELLASEQEYLLARKADRELGSSSFAEVALGGKNLLEAARRRLELWDLSEEQLRELEETGKPHQEITFNSPATGHVLERKVFPNQYVTPETELYKVADHSEVWVYADVYESELSMVEVGQPATLTTPALPGEALKGRVAFIQPHMISETRTLPVRIEVPNPDLMLKPEMFVNVELHRSLGRRLAVPVDAVLDSGEHQRVIVDHGNGAYEPREVKTGERVDDVVVITSGLRAGERVVTRANFLIDSESNLRQAIAGMATGGHAGHGGQGGAPAPAMPAEPADHEGHAMPK